MRRHRRSERRHWSPRGVSGDIGAEFSGDISDCGVGITPQMCNRVTNHGDMGTFYRPRYNSKVGINFYKRLGETNFTLKTYDS